MAGSMPSVRGLGAVLGGLALLAAGCTGSIAGDGLGPSSGTGPKGAGPADSGPGAAGEPASCGSPEPLPRQLRALNDAEYLNALRSVLPEAKVESPFAASDRSAEFSSNAGLRRFDFNATQQVVSNATSAAASAKAALVQRLPCWQSAAPDAACARELVTLAGRELYRAPVAEQEIAKLVALFELNKAGGADEAAALVVQAMLSSPRFLFRKELGKPAGVAGQHTLTSYEIAEAIAFTLTDAPPDQELRSAADADTLKDPAQLRSQALRLLGSAQGLAGLQAFFSEYLGARNFMTSGKSAEAFPDFNVETRTQVLADFRDTVALTLRSPTPTFEALLTSRTFVVRPRTAALVGWSGPGVASTGSSVAVTDPARLGVLTHPLLMATMAHQLETNPVARGHLVSDKLLCLEVPPPPGAVVFPTRPSDGTPKTLRQTLETEHSVEVCASCHQLMDPLGYPFEVFDAVGRYRTTDVGLPIDTRGHIPQTEGADGAVSNVQELVARIASSVTAQDCFTRHVFKYVAGIDDSPELGCTTSRLAEAFRKQGGSIPELVVATLQSPQFLQRAE